jgi:hypothetical protein
MDFSLLEILAQQRKPSIVGSVTVLKPTSL